LANGRLFYYLGEETIMALKLIIPPGTEPISLDEAKAHCRVETDDDDILIEGLIIAAREYCEGFQNRAYITQTWELWLNAFPSTNYIELPRPPLQTVDSIVYYGTDDIEHEFEDYFVDAESEPGRVVLNYGKSWPSTTLRPANGVRIAFTAGYGEEEYGEGYGEGYEEGSVPQIIKQAMLLLIGHWYENREQGSPTELKEIPKGVDALLWMNRNF
jgi:uncharacterized phiE125 gp8 family phage protein